jgi:hypothetical protein
MAAFWPAGPTTSQAMEAKRVGPWTSRLGHRGRDQAGSVGDGPGQQQPRPVDLGTLAQPPEAVVPAGQALPFQPAGGDRGVLAGDRQRGPVLAGTAAAAEPQGPAVDAPDDDPVIAGMGFGLHQDGAVGHHPGVVAFLDRTNFSGESVQPAMEVGVKHFFHELMVRR